MKKILSILFVMLFISGCTSIPDPNKNLLSIHKSFFEASKIKYKSEFEQDYWQTPLETKLLGSGDCEDQAIYLQKILKDKGWDSEVVFGKFNINVNIYKKTIKDIINYNKLLKDPKLVKDSKKYQKILNDKNKAKQKIKKTFNTMHAWVEITLRKGSSSLILDPTNGIFIPRYLIKDDYYVPILAMPSVIKKIDKYQNKNNVILNYKYNVILKILKKRKP